MKLSSTQCLRCGKPIAGLPNESAECHRCYKIRKVAELTKQIEDKRQQFAVGSRKP